MLDDEKLARYYEVNFAILQHHKTFSLTELDMMLPYEREIYLALLNEHLEQKK